MELHERLSTARPVTQPTGKDPFAEVKNRIPGFTALTAALCH